LKIFGAALDVLPHPEKIALKRAYLNALQKGMIEANDPADPYDALRSLLLQKTNNFPRDFIGKLPIPSMYTPKPSPADLRRISDVEYFAFTDGGGCLDVAREIKAFIEKDLAEDLPFLMIGVDHSLTGGAVMALSQIVGKSNLAVIVFDGHFDAISSNARAAAYRSSQGSDLPAPSAPDTFIESYNCETFLKYLIDDEWLAPENLCMIGVNDFPVWKNQESLPSGLELYRSEYNRFIDDGVSIIDGRSLVEDSGLAERFLEKTEAEYIYISLDADVVDLRENPAVRFHVTNGISSSLLLQTVEAIFSQIKRLDRKIAAIDVMEIDIHLADIDYPGDIANRTLDTAADFIKIFTCP
jgi:arginase family enzyme